MHECKGIFQGSQLHVGVPFTNNVLCLSENLTLHLCNFSISDNRYMSLLDLFTHFTEFDIELDIW